MTGVQTCALPIYDETLSYHALAAALDVSKPTISNWVQRRDDALVELGLVETIDIPTYLGLHDRLEVWRDEDAVSGGESA